MSNLSDTDVQAIAQKTAKANHVRYEWIKTDPTVNSAGGETVLITFVLTPGSSDEIKGERSARTVSEIIREFADAGDERSPIVRYEEKGASRS